MEISTPPTVPPFIFTADDEHNPFERLEQINSERERLTGVVSEVDRNRKNFVNELRTLEREAYAHKNDLDILTDVKTQFFSDLHEVRETAQALPERAFSLLSEIETVTPIANDTLDNVIFKARGYVNSEILQITHKLNRSVAEYGPKLPARVPIRVPTFSQLREVEKIILWE